MSKVLCVTNRLLCRGDFLARLQAVAAASPAGIILREKDLSESDYCELAREVMHICEMHQVQCILHSFPKAARALGADALHMPLPQLRRMSAAERAAVRILGASCHSLEDAKEAERLGCSYLTLGHIFATDCKKGVPPRGISLLRQACDAVRIPIYAIGGIKSENFDAVLDAGAQGGCVMQDFMTCADPMQYLKQFEKVRETDAMEG